MRSQRTFAIGIALALAASQPSLAADTVASWRHKPSASDLLGVWPNQALEQGKGGKAVISCKISLQGALYDCQVAGEDPPGSGFGQAAIALAPQLLMNPPTHDGQPVAGTEVRIPINFEAGSIPLGSHMRGVGPTVMMTKVYSNIPWLEAPTFAQVVAAYPDKARQAKVGGHVALNCRFAGEGRLAHCDVLSETPNGMDFGKAARALVKDFLGPSTDATGASLKGAETQLAITFAPEMLTGAVPVIGKPQWARLPEASSMAANYPDAAAAAHIPSGRVVLQCTVGLAGRLGDCTVDSQKPDGLGFGRAALALSSDFQVTVWTPEGLPTVGGQIRVPILYMAPPDPQTPPAPAPAKP
jgi:TonB family protein